MIGIEWLQDHDARRGSASGAAGGLSEELKRSLGCAEIGEAETDIAFTTSTLA
jgi:hypothetical protein